MVVIESSIYDCYFMLVIGGTDVDNVIVFYGNERRVLISARPRGRRHCHLHAARCCHYLLPQVGHIQVHQATYS